MIFGFCASAKQRGCVKTRKGHVFESSKTIPNIVIVDPGSI